jgi:hypothetical protein
VVDHALSVLVLTEDSSPSVHDTLVPLARKLLQFVERHTRSNRVHFEPAEPEARLAVRANLWRSWEAPHRSNERSIRILRRTLATKILEPEVPGYVLFHFDGDCSWSEREAPEHAWKFESFSSFVQGLRPIVEGYMQKLGLPLDDAEVESRLSRICAIVPFYSIESWLYQSAHLRTLCQNGCGKHLVLIDRWHTDRALVDEVREPKTLLCVGSRGNQALAASFTHELADALYLLEQSFHATVERLQSCPGLADVLRATWSAPPAAPDQRP